MRHYVRLAKCALIPAPSLGNFQYLPQSYNVDPRGNTDWQWIENLMPQTLPNPNAIPNWMPQTAFSAPNAMQSGQRSARQCQWHSWQSLSNLAKPKIQTNCQLMNGIACIVNHKMRRANDPSPRHRAILRFYPVRQQSHCGPNLCCARPYLLRCVATTPKQSKWAGS